MGSSLLEDYFGPSEADAAENADADSSALMEEYLARRFGGAKAREVPPIEEGPPGRPGSTLLAAGLRMGFPVAGAVAGALSPVPGGAYAGGALMGAAGEYLAQLTEGQPTDWQEVGLQGALSAVPFVGKARSIGGGMLLRGAESALLSGTAEGARSLLHGESPDPERMAHAALIGGAIGGVAGGIEGKLATLADSAKRAQQGASLIDELAQGRQAAAAQADDAYRTATAQITEGLPVEDRALFDAFREGRISLAKPGPDGMPLPFNPEQYDRLSQARDAWEALTQQHEAAQGWLPHQQAGEAAQHALETGGDPAQAADAAAQAAELAQARRRVVTERTALDEAKDATFAKTAETRRVEQDATAIAQVVAEQEPPTLGQMGLPGEVGPANGLSAADPERLAPSVIDKVFAPEDVKGLVTQLARDNVDQISEARRGVQTRAQREALARPIVAELADRLGTNPDTFVANLRKRGEAVNAEQMEALKTVLNGTAADFAAAVKDAAANPDDPQTLLRAYKAMTVGRAVLAHKAGAIAETARTMRALQDAPLIENLQGRAFEKLLKEAGTTPDRLKEIVQRAAMLDDPAAMERFMHEAGNATTADRIFEAWQSGLLSGPKTFVRNFVSNAAALGLRFPEEAAAAGIDALRATVTGTPRERFLGEAVADAYGASRGLVGGARTALRAFQTESPSALGAAKFHYQHAIPGKLGRTIRLPLRGLLAADEFWKSLSSEGSIHAQAYREAAMEGAKGTARLERMTQLLTEDRGRLLDNAKAEALYRTFQTQDKAIPRAIVHLRTQIPGARYVIPFVSTIYNLAGFGLERTPLGVLPFAKRALSGELAHGEAVDRLARMAVGTGLAGAVAALVGDGGLTGAEPIHRGEATALRTTGWQRDSVKIGNQYVSYSGLEPVSTMLGTTADAVALFHDPLVAPEDVVARLAFGFARRLGDQPFLTGLQQVLDASQNPTSGATFLKRLAVTAIPNVVAQASRAADPIVRRTNGSLGQIAQARTPASTGLLPMRNIWGEEIRRGSTGVEGLLNPFERSPIRLDPASVEVRRLVEAAGLGIQGPSPTYTEQGKHHPIDPEDYDRLSVRAGTLAKAFVTRLVTSQSYQRITDDERRASLVKREFDRARDKARAELKLALAHKVAATAARSRH